MVPVRCALCPYHGGCADTCELSKEPAANFRMVLVSESELKRIRADVRRPWMMLVAVQTGVIAALATVIGWLVST